MWGCGCVSGVRDVLSRGKCVFLCCVEYIQTIMMMEESVQHVVMTAIQEVRRHVTVLQFRPASCSTCVCVCLCVFLQLMSKETPVTGGSDSYLDLDRQVLGGGRPSSLLPGHTCESPVFSLL